MKEKKSKQLKKIFDKRAGKTNEIDKKITIIVKRIMMIAIIMLTMITIIIII